MGVKVICELEWMSTFKRFKGFLKNTFRAKDQKKVNGSSVTLDINNAENVTISEVLSKLAQTLNLKNKSWKDYAKTWEAHTKTSAAALPLNQSLTDVFPTLLGENQQPVDDTEVELVIKQKKEQPLILKFIARGRNIQAENTENMDF
jgi:hypothetical protein